MIFSLDRDILIGHERTLSNAWRRPAKVCVFLPFPSIQVALLVLDKHLQRTHDGSCVKYYFPFSIGETSSAISPSHGQHTEFHRAVIVAACLKSGVVLSWLSFHPCSGCIPSLSMMKYNAQVRTKSLFGSLFRFQTRTYKALPNLISSPIQIL